MPEAPPEEEPQHEPEPVKEPTEEEDDLTIEDPSKVAKLMNFLGDLSQFLPQDKKQAWEDNQIPLKMERIKNTLSQSGLPPAGTSLWPVKGEAASTTRTKLKAIMDRLKEKLAE